jgi:hypothetical protein
MEEHTGDLSMVAKRYKEQVEALENQLAEAKRRLAVVTEAIELLMKEGIFEQEGLFSISSPISSKYRDLSMPEAIEAVLESTPLRKAPARTILVELQKNGFKSASKNLKRDVYTRLFRLEHKGKLISKKERGIKVYLLPPKEVNSLEEKPL